MRTFIALDLPENIREEVSRVTNDFRSNCPFGVKWVPPENLHITFQFIGETKENDISEISEFLEINFSELKMLNFIEPELEIIPGREPRMIWISLKIENSLIRKISKRFKEKLRKMGYKIDSKPLRFHITLGRIKKRLPEILIQQILTTELKMKSIKVGKATLYKSLLRPEGPRYNSLMSIKF